MITDIQAVMPIHLQLAAWGTLLVMVLADLYVSVCRVRSQARLIRIQETQIAFLEIDLAEAQESLERATDQHG